MGRGVPRVFRRGPRCPPLPPSNVTPHHSASPREGGGWGGRFRGRVVTGPDTPDPAPMLPAGPSKGDAVASSRSRSRNNALRHGAYARRVLLPGDSRRDFDALRRGLRRDYNPVGTMENELVERAAVLAWRLRRGHHAEAVLFTTTAPPSAAMDPEEEAEARAEAERMMTRFLRSRGLTIADLPTEAEAPRRARGIGRGPNLEGVLHAAPALVALGNYEAGLQRQLSSVIALLERHQRTRSGDRLPPPEADVDDGE